MPINASNALTLAHQLRVYTAEAANFSDMVDVLYVAQMIEKFIGYVDQIKQVMSTAGVPCLPQRSRVFLGWKSMNRDVPTGDGGSSLQSGSLSPADRRDRGDGQQHHAGGRPHPVDVPEGGEGLHQHRALSGEDRGSHAGQQLPAHGSGEGEHGEGLELCCGAALGSLPVPGLTSVPWCRQNSRNIAFEAFVVKPESYVGLSCVAFQRRDGAPQAEPTPDQQLRLRCTTGRPNISLSSFHIKVGQCRGSGIGRGPAPAHLRPCARRTASPWPPSSCRPACSPARPQPCREPTASSSCSCSATGNSSAAPATPPAWLTMANVAAWPLRSSTPGRVRAARRGARGALWGSLGRCAGAPAVQSHPCSPCARGMCGVPRAQPLWGCGWRGPLSR